MHVAPLGFGKILEILKVRGDSNFLIRDIIWIKQ